MAGGLPPVQPAVSWGGSSGYLPPAGFDTACLTRSWLLLVDLLASFQASLSMFPTHSELPNILSICSHSLSFFFLLQPAVEGEFALLEIKNPDGDSNIFRIAHSESPLNNINPGLLGM